MIKIIIIVIVIAIIAPNIQSSSLQSINEKFRALTGEHDTTWSNITDSTVKIFYNFAQHKLVRLGGYNEKRVDYVFDHDSSKYVLPSEFRNIKGLMLKSQYHAEWQTIFNNPLMATPDTSVMQYTISRKDKDSADIHLRFGVVGKADYDFIYNEDSIAIYLLPEDFKQIIKAFVISEGQFVDAIPNPYFMIDTNANSYFDFKNENDTSFFYYKSGTQNSTNEDDTIRVFYNRTAISGDSIRILYYAGVSDLDTLDDTTVITEDMEGFIIEEMIGYYERYLRDPQAFMNNLQTTRQDMGIEMRGREGAKAINPNQ